MSETSIAKIKELFLNQYKFTHKSEDRIKLFEIIIEEAIKYSLPIYVACFSGYVFWIKKDYGKAIRFFQEAISLDQSVSWAWNGLGNVYIDLKNYEKAKEYFEKAIQLDEAFSYPCNGLGRVYADLKDYEKAKVYFKKAIQLDGAFSAPWYGLGRVYADLKDYEKAKECFARAIQLYEAFPFPWNGLGNVYAQLKDYEKAKECFEKAIQLYEASPHPLNGLGNVYADLKDYEKAKECFEKAIQLDEASPYPWNGLGNVYAQLKDYEKAKECFEKAIQLDEAFPHPWNGLGNVYADLKDYEKAKECYQKAIQLDEAFPHPWNGLGNVYAQLKDYEKAKECFEKAIQLDGAFSPPWNSLGRVYAVLKDYEKAKECYDKAIQLDSEEAGYQFNLSLLFFAQGLLSKAKEHLKNAKDGFTQERDSYFLDRINDLLQLIESSQKLEQLLPQELKKNPMERVLFATREKGLAEEAARNQRSFNDFLREPETAHNQSLEDFLLVLKRWNSYTPIVADNFQASKGGGYFLKIAGKGIVIDPGFNFIDNFRAAKRFLHEIDAVLVSHAHNDHTADLESILTLLAKYNEEIKDSADPTNEKTIRREIARQKEVKEHEITIEDIDRTFLSSNRRKVIDFYITASVFKKFAGWFDLFAKNDYRLHIIEPGDQKVITDHVTVHFLLAKHKDIVSDRNSVGFFIIYNDLSIIYTGDTGWDSHIEEQYKIVNDQVQDKYRLLIANLGGLKKAEETFLLAEADQEKAFYPNHLGRLGLVRVNELLKPNVCIISEFGEELREWRQDISDIYQEAFEQKIIFIPGDTALKFDLNKKKVWAIIKINLKNKKIRHAFIRPQLISSVLLRKDFSLHYYKNDAKFKKEDLVQILGDAFEMNQR